MARDATMLTMLECDPVAGSMASNNCTDVNLSMDAPAGRLRPRVFVDLSTSWRLLEKPTICALRSEREIVRRLLLEPDISPVPFVFSIGRMYALDRTDALRLIEEVSDSEYPRTGLIDVSRGSIAPVVPAAPIAARKPSWPRVVVRAMVRPILRFAYVVTPIAARDDLSAVLRHAREIVRKSLRPSGPTQPTQPQRTILSRGIETGWPASGDVLFTCGNLGAAVPLRQLAEARERHGFACVATWYGPDDNENLKCSGEQHDRLADECAAVDLLDVADRILCRSEAARYRLLAIAAKCARDAPDAKVVTLGCDPLLVVPFEAPTGDNAAAVVVSHILEFARGRAA